MTSAVMTSANCFSTPHYILLRVPGTWARLLKILITTMNSKNSSSLATRQQHKRSCPASEDSDTDGDSNSNFARWLVIESIDSDQPLTRLSPFVLGKALNAQIGTLTSIKRLQRGDVLVETGRSTYSRMLLGCNKHLQCGTLRYILLALDVVRKSKEKHLLLPSDSYSSLTALGGSHVDQDTIYKYLKTYSTLTNSGKTAILCWIPGHVGIPGNERADRVAKAALSLPISPFKISVSEGLPPTRQTTDAQRMARNMELL